MTAWTEADVTALRKAIAQGVKRVSYESGEEKRDVTYHSLDDMRALLASMEATVSPTSARPRRTVAFYNSGL